MNSQRPSSSDYATAFRLAQEGGVSEVIGLVDSPDPFIRHDAIKQIGMRRLLEAAPRLEELAKGDSRRPNRPSAFCGKSHDVAGLRLSFGRRTSYNV